MSKIKSIPILMTTVVILVGGGALYLKIKPGPGKKLDVVQPAKEKKSIPKTNSTPESLTPAEKAVKRDFEDYLQYRDIIYRNVVVEEAENDGYEAVVIASVEIRDENKQWQLKYTASNAKLVGKSWSTKIGSMYGLEQLRTWRDVKILDIRNPRLLPPESETKLYNCGPGGVTTKAEVDIEAENKSDKERELKIFLAVDAVELAETSRGSCGEWKGIGNAKLLKLPPQSKDTYTISLKRTDGGCCVYSQARLGKFDDPNDIIETIDGYGRPNKSWWLDNPQHIP